ncbi:hypothetical protein BDQ12DRAFT_629095 [Crucibulum laeve]|uniref:RING-type E3 ubiquitin transferase n=1 Tax=Crucibulum laeve TaxID=68775 RepID=A0A5C3M417_9AGAR|nr:hypothetical protein BDQ12DRAFT_629095 [Crucibulum laeve]
MDTAATDEEAGLPGRGQRPRSSVPSFLFISFMLFMLTSHNGDEFLARHQYQDSLRSLSYQLSNYTAWMNGNESDFTVPTRDSAFSPLLDAFNIHGTVLDPNKQSYYSNITGFIHGSAQFYNITSPSLANNDTIPWKPYAEMYMADTNLTEVIERTEEWNWTASTKLAMSVVEKKPLSTSSNYTAPKNIALVHGRIEITDVNTSEDLRLEFEGVHFVSNGSIYGFAEPTGRHIDIRLLPSLVPETVRNETARIVAPELEARINKLKTLIDDGIIDQETSSTEDSPKSTCPFTFHGQILPAPVPEYLMQDFEDEIQNPTGIWTIDPPKLSVTGLLLSKECGIMYEVKDTQGLRSKTFFRKVTTYAGMAGLAYLALLILFARQTEHSRTPSGISRVSRWTFLAQSTVDSVSFAGHITFAILAEGRPSLSLIAPAFLACVLFIQEAQFAGLAHQIQAPESTTPTPVAAPTPTNTPPTPLTAADSPATYPPTSATLVTAAAAPTTTPIRAPNTLPAPTQTTTAPQSPSFFSFFIHHIRTDPQAKLWLTLFVFLTLIVRVILSPTLSMLFVAVTYSFIWLPQIFRSARRGRSSGLKKEYIIGTTICRLYSALYFLACPKNVLEIEPRPWSYLLASFVCFQALVLILQDYLGPSFFLPERYVAVKVYDYHPPMPLPDAEAPEQTLGDCAICMDAIAVDPALRRQSKSFDEKDGWDTRDAANGASSTRRKGKSVASAEGLLNAMHRGVGANARKSYSLAPCHHLFHTECLEKWLAIKNICPQCRRPLPPL